MFLSHNLCTVIDGRWKNQSRGYCVWRLLQNKTVTLFPVCYHMIIHKFPVVQFSNMHVYLLLVCHNDTLYHTPPFWGNIDNNIIDWDRLLMIQMNWTWSHNFVTQNKITTHIQIKLTIAELQKGKLRYKKSTTNENHKTNSILPNRSNFEHK